MPSPAYSTIHNFIQYNVDEVKLAGDTPSNDSWYLTVYTAVTATVGANEIVGCKDMLGLDVGFEDGRVIGRIDGFDVGKASGSCEGRLLGSEVGEVGW